jgi:hypothetical protein
MVEISKETFNELVQNPNKITLDQSIAFKNIIKKYPFFQVARVIELIGLKKFNNIRYKNALKKTSIYSTSRVNLFEIIEEEKIKSTTQILSSESTKNSFIKWLKASKTISELENNQNSLIDNFLNSDHKIISKKEFDSKDFSSDFQPSKSEYMTETLAKIYFEQKKFKEAIRAYEILCLKYPEKSSLFADQIKTIKNNLKNI